MARECAFCPSKATTCEHLWGAWLSKLLGPKKKYVLTRRVKDEVLRFKSVGLHEKAPVLCDDCNNVWGSQIETKTKLVIADMASKGSPAKLSDVDVMTIAIFAMMKAFVGDYMHEQTKSSFHSRAERFAFRRDFTFPVTVQIWLSRLTGEHGIFKIMYSKLPSNIPKRFELCVFTVTMGQLVIQLVSSRWSKKSLRRHADPPFLTQGTFWDAFSVDIFPYPSLPVHWPRPKQFDRLLLDEFIKRWEKVNRIT